MSCVTKGVSVRLIFVVNAERRRPRVRHRAAGVGARRPRHAAERASPPTTADRPARADRPG